MPYSFAKCGGIVDYFQGTLTAGERVGNAIKQFGEYDFAAARRVLDEVEQEINQINDFLLKEEDEKPHTIRFFSVPNYDGSTFDTYAVAKISNNGSTYIFGNSKELLEQFAPGGFETVGL